jgi:hypothetical protein
MDIEDGKGNKEEALCASAAIWLVDAVISDRDHTGLLAECEPDVE